MAPTLTCPNCGVHVRLADRFCAHCGDELTLSSHPTSLLEGESHPDDDPESPWAEVVQRLRRATLGEFQIGRELGRGGMAAVFLGHELSLDRKVAIKVMSPGMLMGDGMIDRFRREAITIAHLNHPSIVSCYSVRQAAGLHFFVMRYIRGRSLEQVIQKAGKLPVPIVRAILCQVGSALTYAHRSQVVHRDIKPANILIDEDGNAVVTDFGIAKVAALPGQTHSGALVGTPAYMSPEQCSGAEVSGASDQYAMGAVAYEMVTGVAPFIGSTLTVMQAQVETPPTPIRERAPECPPELEAAILKMLAKDPADRFPTMADAKGALGATPLMEDDPLLAELCRLAAVGTPSPPTGIPRPSSGVSSASASAAGRSAVRGNARSVIILPPPAELAVGDSFALVALVRGERGIPLPGRTVEWTTDQPSVLHLDQVRKVATAVSPGSVSLTATCDEVWTRVTVEVPPNVVVPFDSQAGAAAAALQISAPPRSVRVGDSFVLTATPVDRQGHPLPEAPVLWSTSDVSVAVVTSEGWVAALGRGQVTLTATRGPASASVTIYVDPAIPAIKPAKLPVERARPEEPEPPRRTSWRRRSRTGRILVNGGMGAAAVVASMWLFGGLRDFRWNRDQPASARRDSVASSTGSDSSSRIDSIPPINRGAGVVVDSTPRPRRSPGRRVSAAPLSVSRADTVRSEDSTVVADNSTAVPGRLAVDSGAELTSYETLAAAEVPSSTPDTSAYVPLNPEPAPPAVPTPAPAAVQRSPARAKPEPKPTLPPAELRELQSRIRDGVADCYGAVRSKNLDRLAEMYHPKTYADEEKLRRLTRILRTEPWRAVIGKRVDGAREVGAATAAAEFSFRLTWRNSLGGRLSSQPIFRAEFSRSGDEWAMSSCRIVGSPKL